MGGTVSSGRDNNELVDNLVEAEFIRTPMVQQAFRAVDRAHYYLGGVSQAAYRDAAWRCGNFHISAPCVYSAVLEALKLQKGMSFLNLGSGTGYLNTVAGLMLGPYGTNHGIELHKEVVKFADDKVENFLIQSVAVDEFDFCEPIFVQGNCLWLDSNCPRYDRVYCGAACPPEYEFFVKNLVKIGGILVMPSNEKLLRVTRTNEREWHSVKLLSVNFVPLVCPSEPLEPANIVKMDPIAPPSLKSLCRFTIRSQLRVQIDSEHPSIRSNIMRRVRRPHTQLHRIFLPYFDDSSSQSDSDADDSDGQVYFDSHVPSRMSVILSDFLRRHAELQLYRVMEGVDELATGNGEWEPQPPVIAHVRGDDRAGETYNRIFSLFTVTDVQPDFSDEGEPDDSDSGFDLPPAASTRSKRKRKATSGRNEAGTSGLSSEPKAKVKRTTTKRATRKKSKKTESETQTDPIPVEETYTSAFGRKIALLPLPQLLVNYLLYYK